MADGQSRITHHYRACDRPARDAIRRRFDRFRRHRARETVDRQETQAHTTRRIQHEQPYIMANPPWEPYPERKRKLEERANRPKNKHDIRKDGQKAKLNNTSNSSRSRNPATDSSFSSFSSTSTLPGVVDNSDTPQERTGERKGHFNSDNNHHHQRKCSGESSHHVHARKRPENCQCLEEGGCGDEDGCCMEDLPRATECPCHLKNMVDLFEVVGQ